MKRKSLPNFLCSIVILLLSFLFLGSAFPVGHHQSKNLSSYLEKNEDSRQEAHTAVEEALRSRSASSDDQNSSELGIVVDDNVGQNDEDLSSIESKSSSFFSAIDNYEESSFNFSEDEREWECRNFQEFKESLLIDLNRFSENKICIRASFEEWIKALAENLLKKYEGADRDGSVPLKWREEEKSYNRYKKQVYSKYHCFYKDNKDKTLISSFQSQQDHFIDASFDLSNEKGLELGPIKEKLIKDYEKILLLSGRNESPDILLSVEIILSGLEPSKKKLILQIFQIYTELIDESIQACSDGRSYAVDELTQIIEKYKKFLLLKQGLDFDQLDLLLLRGEGIALLLKMEADPRMREVVDQERASFPWDFKMSYHRNITDFKFIVGDGSLEEAKRERFNAVQGRLKIKEVLIPQRLKSEFKETKNGDVKSIELLTSSNSENLLKQGIKMSEKLKEALDKTDFSLGVQKNMDLDPLAILLKDRIQKIESCILKKEEENVFLKAIEETNLLYPYIQKKIDLCNEFMVITPSENSDQFHWNKTNNQLNEVLTQLDQLAASRLFAEKIIHERQDPWLAYALDAIRSEDELKFANDSANLITFINYGYLYPRIAKQLYCGVLGGAFICLLFFVCTQK